MSRDLLPGYDCPHEAVFLPTTVHTALGSSTQERAICIFEQDTGRPLTRHQGYMEGEFGAVKGYVLTIRSISTVGKCVDHIVVFIEHYSFGYAATITVSVCFLTHSTTDPAIMIFDSGELTTRAILSTILTFGIKIV